MAVNVTIPTTRKKASIAEDGRFTSSSDAYSVVIPVTVGKRYAFAWTNTDENDVGTVFRFGFSDIDTISNQILTRCFRTSPQASSYVQLVADQQYLILQCGVDFIAENITNGYITLTEFSDTETLGMDEGLRIRRPALASKLSEWDYEWDASKGILTVNNNGFIKTTAGGYVPTIVEDYMQNRGSNASYNTFEFPSTFTIGVIEADLMTYSTNSISSLRFGNGTYGIGVIIKGGASASARGVWLGTSTSGEHVFTGATTGTKRNIRLVLKGQTADVYVDGTMVAEDVNVTEYTDCATILYRGGASGSGNQYNRLYTLKMKFNRTT